MNAAVLSDMARGVWTDLREKRLWPVALALIVGMIAVPVLLSRSGSAAPAPTPLASGAGAAGGIPALNVQNAANSRLYGHGRDPFGQQGSGRSGSVAATQVPGSGGSAASTASGGVSAGGAGGGTTASGGSGGGSAGGATSTVATGPAPAGGAPPPPVPASKPAPAPSGLSPTEAYRVSVSATDASGGVNAIDPVERLSVLPSPQRPLVVELGVLRGGSRVLFAVAPGTTLRGPGVCIPGPIDCEILSLGTSQTESLSVTASSAPAAMFAVTNIATQSYGSAAAAGNARRAVSVQGLAALRAWSLPTLSLFSYDVGLGALVDDRNLTVGG